MKSILKTLTWRVIASTTTFVLTYAVTGDTKAAGAIAVVDGITKMVFYVWHEKAWERFWNAKETDEPFTTTVTA